MGRFYLGVNGDQDQDAEPAFSADREEHAACARFEIWFKPDSQKTERKLAERIFKIEGWQR